VFSDLEYGLGLLKVKSSPGVHPNPPFGPILDSTETGVVALARRVAASEKGAIALERAWLRYRPAWLR